MVDKVSDGHNRGVAARTGCGELLVITVGLIRGQVFQLVVLFTCWVGLDPIGEDYFGNGVGARGEPRKRIIAIRIGDGRGFIGIELPVAVLVQVDGPSRKARLIRTVLAVPIPVKPLGALDST